MGSNPAELISVHKPRITVKSPYTKKEQSEIQQVSGHSSVFNSYAFWLRSLFGTRVQKISINTGESCPSRTSGSSCLYCSPLSFLPSTAGDQLSPQRQFEEGIFRFDAKYPRQKYVAYLQGYTSTNASLSRLEAQCAALLGHSRCEGLVIGTRPDCVSGDVLTLLTQMHDRYSPRVFRVELGIESFSKQALQLCGRGCTVEDSVQAIKRVDKEGIAVDIHYILGLPGAGFRENPANIINSLPVSMVKFHQFQLVKGSSWYNMWKQTRGTPQNVSATGSDFILNEIEHSLQRTVDDYLSQICDILRNLRPETLIGRLCADARGVIAHESWNQMKNYRFSDLVRARFMKHGWQQGDLYS